MYRTSGISTKANSTARFNAQPRQLLGQQVPASRPPLLANFRDHLSDSYDSEDDPQVAGGDNDDDLIVTGSRPAVQPHIIIDVNSSALDGPPSLNPGYDVELIDHSFLRIIEYTPGSQYIRGSRLLRQNHPELFMPERRHELVQLIKADENLNARQTLCTIPVASILRSCKIVFTNQHYKQLNYCKDIQQQGGEDVERPLFFCRWTSADANVGTDDEDPDGPPLAGRIEHLHCHQADNGVLVTRDRKQIEFRTPDAENRKKWRGEANCKLRGSHVENRYGMQKHKYTFGDAFAGAGGTSAGALAARLKMRFAFDLDRWAMETYAANFALTGTQILLTDVSDFVRTATASPDEFIVDILHMSPPCQPFCGANRTPNEEDNRLNLAAFAKVADLLEICTPRIATLEEAKSLTDSDKREHFRKLICFFIKKGYSVQWKAVDLWKFGVPQTRKRMIIIASG